MRSMLYTQRKAYAAMPRLWRPIHKVLWTLYWPIARWSGPRRLWGLYRQTWPR